MNAVGTEWVTPGLPRMLFLLLFQPVVMLLYFWCGFSVWPNSVFEYYKEMEKYITDNPEQTLHLSFEDMKKVI